MPSHYQYEQLANVVLSGRYKLLRHITTTKMSVVYQAFDLRKNIATAIKIHLSQEPRHLKMFEREAELARRLQHDHIVSSYDHDLQGEIINGLPICYIALIWVDGSSLHETIQRNATLKKNISLQQASTLLTQIAGALEYAHHNRIIHRDVKPTNILMDVRRGPMLIDFGIAKIKSVDPSAASAKILDTIGAKVETIGSVQDKRTGMGAARYRSPEQVIGAEEITERCDQYSLAITLYECLSNGISPYQEWLEQAQKSREMSARHSWDVAHVQGVLTPLSSLRPEIPSSVSNVLKRALERNPKERYASCVQFADEFAKAVNAMTTKPGTLSSSDKMIVSHSPVLQNLVSAWRQITSQRLRPK